MKRQMIVRIEGRDFSAVSDNADLKEAKIECLAQLQQLVFNNLRVMPSDKTLIANMKCFKQI